MDLQPNSKMDLPTRQTVIHHSPSTSTRSPRSPLAPQRTSSYATAAAARRQSHYSNYSEKPLPDPLENHNHNHNNHQQLQRPGTATTEAALKINIRRASEQLRQAREAERMYRATRRASKVHANRTEARAHFAQSVEHLQLGVRKGFLGVVGFPYIIREKMEMRRQKGLEAASERRARKDGKEVAALEAAAVGRELDGDGEMMGKGGRLGG